MSDAEPTWAQDDQVIRLLEETARIETRTVESGRARIHVTIQERDEPIEALLMRQDIIIERVAVGTRVDSAPAVRREGDVVIIPVLEEVLVVEKRLVLKEELHVRIDESRHTETQTVRLRREHADIDVSIPTTHGVQS